jgi:hypothetical protein
MLSNNGKCSLFKGPLGYLRFLLYQGTETETSKILRFPSVVCVVHMGLIGDSPAAGFPPAPTYCQPMTPRFLHQQRGLSKVLRHDPTEDHVTASQPGLAIYRAAGASHFTQLGRDSNCQLLSSQPHFKKHSLFLRLFLNYH